MSSLPGQKPAYLFVGEPLIEFVQETAAAPKEATGYAGDLWPNMAYYFTRANRELGLGLGNAFVYGAVGGTDDTHSQRVLARMEQVGCDTSLVKRIDGKALGTVTNRMFGPEHERRELDRAKSASRDMFDDLEAKNLLKDKAALVTSGIPLGAVRDRSRLLTLMKMAREEDIQTVFSTNYRGALWELDGQRGETPDEQNMQPKEKARHWMSKALALTDIAFVSHDDEKLLHGDISPEATAKRIHNQFGCREIIVTSGREPGVVYYKNASDEMILAPIQVTPAQEVDVVGAGDSFAATYLALREKSATPEQSVGAAAKIAAQVVGFKGAVPSSPHLLDYEGIRADLSAQNVLPKAGMVVNG